MLSWVGHKSCITLEPDIHVGFKRKIVKYFIHQIKHLFWVLKRTVSSFWAPQTYVLVEN